MCRFTLTDQPGIRLEVELSRVPHSTDWHIRIEQILPTAANPRAQALLDVCLPREDLHWLGRRLINDSQ